MFSINLLKYLIILILILSTSSQVFSQTSSPDYGKYEIVTPNPPGGGEKTIIGAHESKFFILDADGKKPVDPQKLMEINPLDKISPSQLKLPQEK